MLDVEIKRPTVADREELGQFFAAVITDTFAREGLADARQEIAEEVATKKEYLERDFVSDGANRHFLLAVSSDEIIGTIEYGPASGLIDRCTSGALKGLVEVGTVFVRPDYQRRGVGNQLLSAMLHTLKSRGIREFCLDSGYTNAQRIWRRKFGEPDYLLEAYWDESHDHMIWKLSTDELLGGA